MEETATILNVYRPIKHLSHPNALYTLQCLTLYWKNNKKRNGEAKRKEERNNTEMKKMKYRLDSKSSNLLYMI